MATKKQVQQSAFNDVTVNQNQLVLSYLENLEVNKDISYLIATTHKGNTTVKAYETEDSMSETITNIIFDKLLVNSFISVCVYNLKSKTAFVVEHKNTRSSFETFSPFTSVPNFGFQSQFMQYMCKIDPAMNVLMNGPGFNNAESTMKPIDPFTQHIVNQPLQFGAASEVFMVTPNNTVITAHKNQESLIDQLTVVISDLDMSTDNCYYVKHRFNDNCAINTFYMYPIA